MQFYEPVSTIIKPDSNTDVAAWVAWGNQITELPFGHSNFKDGNIPYAKQPVRKLDIEKYNAERVTRHTPVNPPKKEKTKKATKAKTVKPLVIKQAQAKKATKLKVYSVRSMIYMHNRDVFKNARENQIKEFEALCIRHGFSTFQEKNNKRYRCLKCLTEYNENNVKDYKRRVLNQELMKVAVLAKQKKFIGVCRLHGETRFSIARTPNTISKLNYKCCICSTTAQMKSRKKKGAAA